MYSLHIRIGGGKSIAYWGWCVIWCLFSPPSIPLSLSPSLPFFLTSSFSISLPPSSLLPPPSLSLSFPFQVSDLQKKSSELKVIVDENCTLAERLVAERITKQQYLSDEKGNTSRMQRLQQDINAIVKTL